MMYKGPKSFERLVRAYYNATKENLPKHFEIIVEPKISVSLEDVVSYDHLSGPDKETLNPNRLLGFESEDDYNKEIDLVISEHKEGQRLKTARALRSLCGPEVLQMLANTYAEAFEAAGIGDYAPLRHIKIPGFGKGIVGIDSAVHSSYFFTYNKLGFNPNLLSEIYLPGTMLGEKLPEHLKNDNDLINYIHNFLRSYDVGVEQYQNNLKATFFGLMIHGLVHSVLATNFPYRPLTLASIEKNEQEVTRFQDKVMTLDLDVLNEATARVVGGFETGCDLLEDKKDKVNFAVTMLRNNPNLTEKVQTIIWYSWYADRNALDLLKDRRVMKLDL